MTKTKSNRRPFLSMFYKKKADNLKTKIKNAKKYEVNYKQGLTADQVKERKDAGLTNEVTNTIQMSYLQIIAKNIFTVLNILLITLAVVMLCFGLYPRLFFVVILTLNVAISLVQDIKAKHLISRLSLISNPHATVIRDGERVDVPFDGVVLSDVILLQAGKTIPCDAEIIYGSIRVNESFLSGETDAVTKTEGKIIFAQSYVTSGTAYAKVIQVGNANYANQLQEKARSFVRPSSEILKSLKTIIRVISIGAITIGLAEVITYSVGGKFSGDWKTIVESVDAITSSLVAMIPCGMYLMTSISLTVGVLVLGRNRMLVRELYSIEMLARVNVLCLDKTGTLTDGNMEVKEVVPFANVDMFHVEDIIGKILYVTKDENLTARALRVRYATKKIEGDCVAIPFDSEKKYSAASFNNHTYVMGAFGFFDITNTEKTKKVVERYERLGRRVLVVAEGERNIVKNRLPGKLTAIAVIVLVETIKSDARKNINWFKQNDVDLRVISGDSANSLKAIALEVGLDGANQVISLDGLSDEEVAKAALKYKIFARVSPEQKKLIISSLRKNGSTVAMIGDGVNDLLALKAADCSIAMANGADAAKSVSHLVSLDSNFSSLPKVVEEGRRVINNLQRVCSIFLVKTIFAFFFAILYLFLGWLHMHVNYPFTTNNLFLWEVLTIGIAPFFIALEPNKERITSGFISNIVKEAIPAAFLQIFMCLPLLVASYISPEYFPLDGAVAMSVILFTVMSLVILLHVCFPLNKYRKIVLIATCSVMALLITIDVITFYLVPIMNFLAIDYSKINNACLLLGLLTFIVSIPAYIIVAKYFKVFINRRKGKK
ncbi:MAG: HAD-IC family P-type ATPase [Bacilli bacterium]|nr:HAD-IC family P-type ATPase [Bacilli bacterium]